MTIGNVYRIQMSLKLQAVKVEKNSILDNTASLTGSQPLGVAAQSPESQCYPNHIVKFKFYCGIIISSQS